MTSRFQTLLLTTWQRYLGNAVLHERLHCQNLRHRAPIKEPLKAD